MVGEGTRAALGGQGAGSPVPAETREPLVIAFIGWHNSGKTTLACQVVAHLKTRGYRLAVIKSSKERGLAAEGAQTDTARYHRAGADRVALLTPDQLLVRSQPPDLDLRALVGRLFADMDLVIAEGFKFAAGVDKIEVRRDPLSPLLRDQVEGVVAVATDLALTGSPVFGLDQAEAIADFIKARLEAHRPPQPARIILSLDQVELPLPEPLQQELIAAILALLAPLQPTGRQGTLELRLRCPLPATREQS